MDLRDYCESAQIELSKWKSKIDEITSALEDNMSEKREELYSLTNELKAITKEIADKIDLLQRECPAQWEAEKIKLQSKFEELKTKWEEAEGKLPSESFIG